jgi:hypothetical protein
MIPEHVEYAFSDKDILGYYFDRAGNAVNLKVRPGTTSLRFDFFHLSLDDLDGLLRAEKQSAYPHPIMDKEIAKVRLDSDGWAEFYPNSALCRSLTCGLFYLTVKELQFLRDLFPAAPAVTSLRNAVAQLTLKVDQLRHEAGQYFQARNYKLAEATNELAASIEKALKEHAQNTANS